MSVVYCGGAVLVAAVTGAAVPEKIGAAVGAAQAVRIKTALALNKREVCLLFMERPLIVKYL